TLSCNGISTCTATVNLGAGFPALGSVNGATLYIPKFNTNEGTLNSINIRGKIEEYGTGTITNNGSTAQDVFGFFSTKWAFGSTGVSTLTSFLNFFHNGGSN